MPPWLPAADYAMIRAVEGEAMLSKLLRAVAIVATTIAPAAAATLDCPSRDRDNILEVLDQAPTCEQSLALFQACSYGASGDVALSEVVIRKCEGDFLTKLNKSQRQSYDQQQKRCSLKYRNESGTMYRSFEAFCSANLAKDYARRFAKAPKS
jgi:hypothetical protein